MATLGNNSISMCECAIAIERGKTDVFGMESAWRHELMQFSLRETPLFDGKVHNSFKCEEEIALVRISRVFLADTSFLCCAEHVGNEFMILFKWPTSSSAVLLFCVHQVAAVDLFKVKYLMSAINQRGNEFLDWEIKLLRWNFHWRGLWAFCLTSIFAFRLRVIGTYVHVCECVRGIK